MSGKSGFGRIRRLPSGRYQARYTGPDGHMYAAPQTHTVNEHARVWLAKADSAISGDTWRPPDEDDDERFWPMSASSAAGIS